VMVFLFCAFLELGKDVRIRQGFFNCWFLIVEYNNYSEYKTNGG
jgi:hypothetical protein